METIDKYRTIRKPSKGLFRDRGSRFIAIALPVASQALVKELLESYRKEYHDARHHCYAWIIGPGKEQWRINDDGEPSGTAGKPILGQINSNDLTNILIVVIRYFGGTLLGTSGLINAYRSAAADAIKNSEIVECTVNAYYTIKFPYAVLNDVMRIIKEEDLLQSDQLFELECSLKVGFRLSHKDRIIRRLSAVPGLAAWFEGNL
ncbi:MAG TPA: YigZ family protein [Bacteroidales bacterium]|nr:YigZ family protein [Bacteroidales bacterium]